MVDYSGYNALEVHHLADGTTRYTPKEFLNKNEREALNIKPTIIKGKRSFEKLSLGSDIESKTNVETNKAGTLTFFKFEKILAKRLGGAAISGLNSDKEIIDEIRTVGFPPSEYDLIRIYVKKELREKTLEKLESFDFDLDKSKVKWLDKPDVAGSDFEIEFIDER